MMTGLVHDHNLEKHIEKQMGCMTGFLQIFDRHQLLTGKRLYATKRLPPPPPSSVESSPMSEKFVGSPATNGEFGKQRQPRPYTYSSPDRSKRSPVMELRSPSPEVSFTVESPARMPGFEFKEATRSSWKFCKETPRLSLDSRAMVDAKGSLYPRESRTSPAIPPANRCSNFGEEDDDKHRRSPSVIARLMGLEPLPNSSPEPVKPTELRRSASESRVSRDLVHNRSVDGNNFNTNQRKKSHSGESNQSGNALSRDKSGVEVSTATSKFRFAERMDSPARNVRPEQPMISHGVMLGSPWKSSQRKSFYDSADFFPEPKQSASIYGEIEKRLKMRGIAEPSQDLETLKQILEALQLKGLLHSKKPSEQIRRRNFVYDRSFSPYESPIVVIKPAKLPVSPANRRSGNESPPTSIRNGAGARRNLNLAGERPVTNSNLRNQSRIKNSSPPIRTESNGRTTNSVIKRKPLSVEVQRKEKDSSMEQRRRVSHSPSPKRLGSDQTSARRSPRNKQTMAANNTKDKMTTEDESSSISESSVSTSSQPDTTERAKLGEEHRGRSLLERCDKLLNSIAEITATELQCSPVSVLDSSFYKEESSPSPIKKRTIDFKENQVRVGEEENLNPAIWPLQPNPEDQSEVEDCDFVYISQIFRASIYLPEVEDSDVFLLLEQQQYLRGGNDSSRTATLRRKLIFDTIAEIFERYRQLPPWKTCSWPNNGGIQTSLPQIWAEFRRIRERDTAEDLFEIIGGVLRKDLGGAADAVHGWGECPVELSEMVLDIERLIYKDLVGEIIRDLAAFAQNRTFPALRRKIKF